MQVAPPPPPQKKKKKKKKKKKVWADKNCKKITTEEFKRQNYHYFLKYAIYFF